MQLQNSVAIVTGSATGVGAATATLLARKGCRVVVNYTKSEAEAKATLAACQEAAGDALLLRADVADDGDCRRLAAAALERWGRIDALINNAGVSKFADHAKLDLLEAEDFQRIYAVNVIGAFQMVRAVAPAMQRQGKGAVVNISSVAGAVGMGSSIAYAASKGALNTMTLSLARVLGPQIRVNAICPGMIDGRWLRDGYGEAFEKMKEGYEAIAPLRRMAQPEDIAEAALWLIEGADLVTGETIMVDSGVHLGFTPMRAR